MTTRSTDTARGLVLGEKNHLPVIASDIIYEGSAVGVVPASGHARPLAVGDLFAGFAAVRADNSQGSAAALNVEVYESGKISLPVTGAVITDVGLPVYASDDDTFSFLPVGGVFIGYAERFVSAGVMIVRFDVAALADPYAGWVHELKSANYTVDAQDAGKWLWVDTDAVVVTLPAAEGIAAFRVGNIAAFGVSGVAISPNASDMIEGPDVSASDNKDLINTKATARRGDYVEIAYGDANGWSVARIRGTWAREA